MAPFFAYLLYLVVIVVALIISGTLFGLAAAKGSTIDEMTANWQKLSTAAIITGIIVLAGGVGGAIFAWWKRAKAEREKKQVVYA